MSEEPFLLKELFNRNSVAALGRAIAAAHTAFDLDLFLTRVFDAGWSDRELKQRIRHITTVLRRMLPAAYGSALGVLTDAVPSADGLGFTAMVFSDFVEAYGTDDWEASLPALERFTTLASAEFAIRPFIAADQDRTLAHLLSWTANENPAVRRLASEGSRPRLPWGIRLQALVNDPTPIIPILDALRTDTDEAVRRSVANNLNDIAKDHPDVVIDVLRRWSAQPWEHLPALRKHALRTLLKRGHPHAMEMLGFRTTPDVTLESIQVRPPRPGIGDVATLRCTLASTSHEPQPLMVDYVVHYVKASGSTAPKVFKLKTLDLAPHAKVTLTRKLTFVQLSTRTHRAGKHRVDIQVNGTVLGGADFELVEKDDSRSP